MFQADTYRLITLQKLASKVKFSIHLPIWEHYAAKWGIKKLRIWMDAKTALQSLENILSTNNLAKSRKPPFDNSNEGLVRALYST